MQPALKHENKVLHRVRSAAAQLDVSPAQIYTLIRRGELEAVRLGNSIRIPERAIQKAAGNPVPVEKAA